MIGMLSQTPRVRNLILKRSENIRLIWRAMRIGLKQSRNFEDVQTYLMFVGHPRSGHTLAKALLNAHKHIVIGQEVNILRYLRQGFSRRLLFSLILAGDQWFHGSGSIWGEYAYRVRDQWQGRFEKLRVIGDKKAGASTLQLEKNPELLDLLEQKVSVPVKLVFVVRNPYDNIATISRKHGSSLPESIARYFQLCEIVQTLQERYPEIPVLSIFLEDIIADPRQSLQRMLTFLDLSPYPGYLDDCAGIVFSSPNPSRHKVKWTPAQIEQVQGRMQDFDYLSQYKFES